MMSADDWQTDGQAGRVEAGDQDPRRRAAGGRGQREDLRAAGAGQGAPAAAVQGRALALRRRVRRSPTSASPARTCPTRTTGRWARWSRRKGFTTDTNGQAKLSFKLPAGAYRAVLETQDRFGKKVTGKLPVAGAQPDATKLAIKIPQLLAAPDWELQPGQEFMALVGHRLRDGTGVRRDRAPPQDDPALLDQARARPSSRSSWPSPRPCAAASPST